MCMARRQLGCLLCRYLASPDAKQCCNWITCGIIGEQHLGPDRVGRKLQDLLALGDCAAAARHDTWQPHIATSPVNTCVLFAVGAVIGICAVNPDSGDYGAWLNETNQMIAQVSSAKP